MIFHLLLPIVGISTSAPPIVSPAAIGGMAPTPVIVFQSNRDQGLEGIWSMSYDGSNLRHLIAPSQQLPGNPFGPIVDPNGRRIAYSHHVFWPSYNDFVPEVFAANVDGTSAIRLTMSAPTGSEGAANVVLCFDPDGVHVIVRRNQPTGRYLVRIHSFTGQMETLVTSTNDPFDISGNSLTSYGACVSPDGQFIYYTAMGLETQWLTSPQVFRMRRDGTEKTQIGQVPHIYYGISLSPDGTLLAFTADGGDPTSMYTMRVDGSGLTRLDLPGEQPSPRFDGTGARLVFSQQIDGQWDLFSCTITGKDIRRLSTHPARDISPFASFGVGRMRSP